MSVKLNYLKAELNELNSTKRVLLGMKEQLGKEVIADDLKNINKFIRLKRKAINDELTRI